MSCNEDDLSVQLCKAVNDGDPRKVEALLIQRANPNLVLSKGAAAVHLAAGKETEKRIRCLRLLLQYGADPNVRSVDGLTPLHIAALWGCYQNLKLLLQNGGDANLEDQDGNKAADLADEQENRKCAQLLQEYQSYGLFEPEEEDPPRFQYSFYHSRISGDSFSFSGTREDTCAIPCDLSLLSDCPEGPLSSTRRSSQHSAYLNLSAISARPSVGGRCRRSGQSDLSDLAWRHTQTWRRDSEGGGEPQSVLSSTRISTAGGIGVLPVLQEDLPLSNCSFHPKPLELSSLPSNPEPVDSVCSSRRASRKSVSFKEGHEYFPATSAESHSQPPTEESSPAADETFDISEYSEFLDLERMATVLNFQGIDVTSPDHVFVFSRDAGSVSPDLDKTLVGHWPIEEEEADEEPEEIDTPVQPPPCSSSSSGSSGSRYSSCDSEPYTSAVEGSLHHRLASVVEEESSDRGQEVGPQPGVNKSSSFKGIHTPITESLEAESRPPSVVELPRQGVSLGGYVLDVESVEEFSQPSCSSSLETLPIQRSINSPNPDPEEAALRTMLNNLMLSTKVPQQDRIGADVLESMEESLADTVLVDPIHNETDSCLSADEELARQILLSSKLQSTSRASEEEEQPLMLSPFVTGRTRSRLSRCSLRANGSSILSSPSFLFDETLPTPTRLRRRTTKKHGDERLNSDGLGSSLSSEFESSGQTQTSLLEGNSIMEGGGSQDDTVLIPGSLADTVILEREESSEDGITDCLAKGVAHAVLGDYGGFVTDDLSSSGGEGAKLRLNVGQCPPGAPRTGESWVSDDLESSDPQSEGKVVVEGLAKGQMPDSCSSDDSPESQRDLPATPGAGYTPRYSVSRLSACHQPQRLADLSYTPGGRPLIPEVEEPVEYLYTDTEEGHELIECHVPPTANHTLSSDVTSSEDTVLYDWKSFHASPGKGKENQLPQEEVPSAIHKLPDRELRRQLQELGEEPGPINKTTRLIYMQQLCRLQHKQPKHNPGYSPELAASMHTFQLPDCRAHELALCQQFDQPDQNRKWREGVIKSSFNYLLLDPRVTTNLPSRSVSMHPAECFQTFIKAIFYVGKGKRSRPYSHLYEALEYYRGDRTSKKLCSKVQHILQVWATGQGVISLHCFQNVIPVEAYTREACMVDAMGLKMLTNKKRGDYYGVVATWPMKQRRELGVHLLYRAMLIFLAEGERQLRPADLRAA
ncbi:uncharacterized protein LOC136717846 [Amia ocellicauda]|uniref:uncharacterized protein LOC136717846 n=1 Tax=Amia ocellicauda TaxID=2972642 RepID=UPI0034641C12